MARQPNIPKPKLFVAKQSQTQGLVEMYQQGVALHRQGRLAQAKALYEQVLAKQPQHSGALHLLGVIAAQSRNPAMAVELIGKAIEINPNDPLAYSNRANALKELKRFDAALASYDKAIILQPDDMQAHLNRGYTLQQLMRLDAALASFDKAIALQPDCAEAWCSKAVALLLKGEFGLGWEMFEWRWKLTKSALKARPFSQPLWLGKEPLAGRTVLLHAEQGFGDTIQFCRYAKLVADTGARVILEVPKPLSGLLEGLEGVTQLVETGETLPAFDYHCPLLSLPLAFKTGLASIPGSSPYLSSDAGKRRQWSELLGAKTRPRIGLVWSGSTFHKNDRNRSLTLAAVLRHLPDEFEYVSLQKEVREVDTDALNNSTVRHYGDRLADFAETAALCDLMDIVVSVDTSVAHLAGALGRTTWLLLPYVPDWRWMLDRDDSPWYQSFKLYRQSEDRQWEPVLHNVATDLLSVFRLQVPITLNRHHDK